MKILIVNIAWIDNGWTGIDNQTTSGHRYVQEGGIAHESLNFKFDGKWNNDKNIYGFCQFTNPPKIEGDNNILVFYSKNKIVGVYTNVELGNFKPNNIPSEIEHFNLKASRENSFKLNKYIEFNHDKHLPSEKKKVGQIGFTYIEQEQLLNILNDMLEVNLELYDEIEDIKNYLGIEQKNKWDDFIKTIDFEKIKNISKQVKDENLREGLRIRSFLKNYFKYLQNIFTALQKYKIGQNQSPTQKYWSKDNGFRVGFYRNNTKYKSSVQINITIGADWGGGVFLKDESGLIFENTKLLEYLMKRYSILDFNIEKKHIGAKWFGNNINDIPKENEVLKYINNLCEIYEIAVKGKKMEEKTNLLEYQKQIILQGPPGTGKTRLAKQIANFMINGEVDPKIDGIKDQVKLIQFHPSYSYEDFVRGIVAKSNGVKIEYKTENKILAEMAKQANEDLKKNGENANQYILIIDEINRANLSSVLGELIYALEYRDEAVESMYTLDDGTRDITLPSNLYIIGTMNTADRSVGHIDYAIRRRFAFEDVLPDISKINLEEGKNLFNKVEGIFQEISPDFNKEDVMLGHSYFIAENLEELEKKLEYQIEPLLKEYIKDGVLNENAKEKIDGLRIESDS